MRVGMRKRYALPAVCLALALIAAGCAKNAEALPEGDGGEPEKPGVLDAADPEPEAAEPGDVEPGSEEPEDTESGNVEPENTEPGDTEPEGTGPESEKPEPADGETGGMSPEPSRPSSAGALSVRGTDLVDRDGNKVRLRGISTHGLAWYPQYVNRELFRELSRDWGVNAVRLAMYTAEYGGYCAGGDREELYRLVTEGVRYATAEGMYVIIDWHTLSDGDPNTYGNEAVEFFDRVSRELGDRDNVLYEICNEPNGGTSWRDVKSYAERLIPVIRENDPDAVILVGTPEWCQRVDLAAGDPITGYDNIMYTLHFYAATHRAELRERMERAIEKGLPVFVSEFGICDASGNGAIDTREADRWVEAMDRLNVSYMMWSLSNKAESASVIASSCGKKSGFTDGDLTDTGRWLIRTLTGGTPGGETPDRPSEATPDRPPQTDPAEPDRVSGGETSFEWSLTTVNSWTSEDGEYCQYSLTVRNTGEDAAGWSVEIPVEGEVVNSWNGVFSKSAGGYVVANADYNGSLASGAAVTDVGFIIRK